MIYVGMAVSRKIFEVYSVNAKEKKVFKGAIYPTRQGLKQLAMDLGRVKKVFIFEAGNQMKWIAETIKRMDEIAHVVHPNEVKWIVKSNGKTDKVDAKKLAELGRIDGLPRPVVVAEGKERRLRELISGRDNIMNKRNAFINSLKGCVRQEGRNFPQGFFANGSKWTLSLKAMKISETFRGIVASIMNAVESLKNSEDELTAKIKEVDDKKIELIQTVPAIGEFSARVLFSALITAKRFENKKKVANYGALSTTIYQSGDVTNLGHVNRDGRGEIRRVLLKYAHALARMQTQSRCGDFLKRLKKTRQEDSNYCLGEKVINNGLWINEIR